MGLGETGLGALGGWGSGVLGSRGCPTRTQPPWGGGRGGGGGVGEGGGWLLEVTLGVLRRALEGPLLALN